MSDPTPQHQPGSRPAEVSRTAIVGAPASASPPIAMTGRPMLPPPAAPRLRLWPALVILALQWTITTAPAFIPALQGTPWQVLAIIQGSTAGAICIALWWLFASRAPWLDRFLILLFFGISAAAAIGNSHPTFVYFGYGPIARGLPLATTVLVLWFLLARRLSWPVQRLGAAVAIMLAWGYCDLLRLDGVWGDFEAQVSWRWVPTFEQAYMADLAGHEASANPAEKLDKVVELRPGDWPGFRGPNRDSRIPDVRIATDWKQHPPKQLWHHLIGPGWSSFAVIGDRVYTQEQRDKDEVVVCYNANTGAEVWTHTDAARFSETIGGPGPRATPTFYQGNLYTMGAAGNLNCLNAATGDARWSRNIVTDSGAKLPIWGFSSSPLVAQDVVTVFAGVDGKSVLGYHASSGEPAWSAGKGTTSYCSPHLTHLNGVDQVVIATNTGMTGFEPSGGKVLWDYEWTIGQGARTAQPAIIGDSDLLIGTPMQGARRVHVTHAGESWNEEQVWETKDIKPYYNDLVVYKDHLYGFDNNFFTCVGVEDGKGKWRARGYGNGQVLLLAEQGLLLILSEKGEVALVEANPEYHKELSRFLALPHKGKTWNHPVFAHGKLFVRNGEEVACYQLPEEGGKGTSSK